MLNAMTLTEHIDALDKMIVLGSPQPELRSQIAFIEREVAVLEAENANLNFQLSEAAYSGGCRTLIPISVGQGSDFCRTVFRAEVGQFLGIIGMVSDSPGTVSDMDWNGCPLSSEYTKRIKSLSS